MPTASAERSGGGGRTYNDAPLVRKPPKKRVTKSWRPPDHIKGIRHVVEGYGRIKQREMSLGEVKKTASPLSGPPEWGAPRRQQMERNQPKAFVRPTLAEIMPIRQYNERQEQQFEAGISKYEKMQKRRKKIPSLPDPDTANLRRRQTQARKRMRGVLGTLLTQRESLG
jgi:hypothetical protein